VNAKQKMRFKVKERERERERETLPPSFPFISHPHQSLPFIPVPSILS